MGSLFSSLNQRLVCLGLGRKVGALFAEPVCGFQGVGELELRLIARTALALEGSQPILSGAVVTWE